MKKVALFPGIDALLDFRLRSAAYTITAVKEHIALAQEILDSMGYDYLDLKAAMTQEFNATSGSFQAIVLCSVTTQVALFKEYEKNEYPIDMLLGVSLGDLARSHCAGIVSFKEMLTGVLIFTELSAKTIGKGETLYVKIDPQTNVAVEDLELEKYDLEISVHQTKDIFLLSGGVDNLKLWMADVAAPKAVLVRKIFPMPLAIHNKLMNPVADALKAYLESTVRVGTPKYEIFSTNLIKKIENNEEIKEEMVQNVKAPVYFYQSVQKLMEEGEPLEFISIGPAPTMINFISRMEINPALFKVTNYFEKEVRRTLQGAAV